MLWVRLIFSFLGCICIGWLLSAFESPPLIWTFALGLLVYICGVGTRAIALSSASVTALIWAGVVLKAWPVAWDSRVPHENIKLWSGSFFLFWVGTISLISILALTREHSYPDRNRYGRVSRQLLLLGLGGLGLGSFAYHHLN